MLKGGGAQVMQGVASGRRDTAWLRAVEKKDERMSVSSRMQARASQAFRAVWKRGWRSEALLSVSLHDYVYSREASARAGDEVGGG